MNLLNLKSGSQIAIPIQHDRLNAVRLSEDVLSVSDADSTVFHLDKDQGSTTENPSTSEYQSLHGLIPDRISSGTITFDKKDIETVITPESWLIDNTISASIMLINQGNAFADDTTFVPMLRIAVRLKSILDYDAFLEYYFQRNMDAAVSKLNEFQPAAIVNSMWKKTNNGKEEYSGGHLGLALLHKSSAALRLYGSIHRSQGFEHMMPHMLLLANSIRYPYNFTEEEWQIHWTYCRQVYSVQRINGYD